MAHSPPLALNVIIYSGSLKEDGYSSEELKVRNNLGKIRSISLKV
jgi:aspartate-semialdehyde dehydrogenase